jgi:4'-phosphopantetheinyl transferase
VIEAVVHRVDVRDVDDHSSLSSDEIERAASFTRPGQGRAWAASRVALRRVLASALNTSPEALSFRRGDRGMLVLEGAPSDLWFNLAHTGDVALVAVCLGAPVGVDVELVRSIPNLVDVAQRVLRPASCAAIADTTPDDRVSRFYREWVRHEARLKCRGTGIVEPEDDDGRVNDLSIVDIEVGAGYAAAVAVQDLGPRVTIIDGVAGFVPSHA